MEIAITTRSTVMVLRTIIRKNGSIEDQTRVGPLPIHRAISNNWLSKERVDIRVDLALAYGVHRGCRVYQIDINKWVVNTSDKIDSVELRRL